jgi:hypothetical protein
MGNIGLDDITNRSSDPTLRASVAMNNVAAQTTSIFELQLAEWSDSKEASIFKLITGGWRLINLPCNVRSVSIN